MSPSMFNCSALLFDGITKYTSVAVCSIKVCMHSSFPVRRDKTSFPVCSSHRWSQISDTSQLWSALCSLKPLIESMLDYFLVVLSLVLCPMPSLSFILFQRSNRDCAVSLWLLIWYFPGIIVTSEYVSVHKSDLKREICMPKVQRWVTGIGTVGNSSS